MAKHLFQDTFTVTGLDPDGKNFDKVTRIQATSENEIEMQLDVNTQIYRMVQDDKFDMVLARTLNLDGSAYAGYFKQDGRKTICDDYDYIMQGKVYKISKDSIKDSNDNSSTEVEIYASFGGLLMILKIDPSSAASFKLDQKLFLLIKKLKTEEK